MNVTRGLRIILFFLGVFVAPWAFPLLCLACLQAAGVEVVDSPTLAVTASQESSR